MSKKTSLQGTRLKLADIVLQPLKKKPLSALVSDLPCSRAFYIEAFFFVVRHGVCILHFCSLTRLLLSCLAASVTGVRHTFVVVCFVS